jgi:hypothetical protein
MSLELNKANLSFPSSMYLTLHVWCRRGSRATVGMLYDANYMG